MSDHYQSLIKEACQIEMQLRDLLFDCRLTPQAIIDACLARSDSTGEDLDRLEETLRAKATDLRHCHAFIRQVSKMFESGRINSGVPTTVSRMAFAPSYLAAQQELATLSQGYALFHLYAIATRETAQKHPAMFGTITDAAERQKQIDKLKTRKAELYERLGQEFDQTDLYIGKIGRDGWAYITMAAAPAVPLVTLSTLGQRLIEHLLNTAPEQWSGKKSEVPIRNNRRGQKGSLDASTMQG